MIDLGQKLRVFVDQGLVPKVPTNWQVAQGSLAMARTVIAKKPDDDLRYGGAPLGSPWLRTPVLVVYTLGGHLRIGSGTRARERHLRTHLLGVKHYGQPVYDLQLVQTFEGGLDRLRRHIDAVDLGRTFMRRTERWVVNAIVPDGEAYRARLHEHIDRAARFDYDDDVPPGVRPEFSTFVRFVNHCAEAFPARARDEKWWPMLGRLKRLFLAPRLLPAAMSAGIGLAAMAPAVVREPAAVSAHTETEPNTPDRDRPA